MKTYFCFFFLLVCNWAVSAQKSTTGNGARCCVDSIIFNTGYDPISNDTLPIGTRDTHWVVDSATSTIIGAAVAGSPAYVISTIPPGWGNWITDTAHPSQWISCVNANNFHTDGIGSINKYNYTLGRLFSTCSADSIKFSLNIADDNYATLINVDDTIAFAYSQSPAGPAYYDVFNPFTQTIYLPAGNHRFNINILNANEYLSNNPSGLNMYGTISSATGNSSIVKESDTSCTHFSSGVPQPQNKSSYSAIVIFPNPVTTMLNISALDKITTVTITNLLGQTQYDNSYDSPRVQINIADLMAGVYIVRINGIEVRKFVKR